jgi:hypothetical protein
LPGSGGRIGSGPLLEIVVYSLFSMSAGIGIYFTFIFYASQVPTQGDTPETFWRRPGNLLRLTLEIILVDLLFSFLSLFLLLPHLSATGRYLGILGKEYSNEIFALYVFPQSLAAGASNSLGVLFYSLVLIIAGFLSLASLIDVAFWAMDRVLPFRRSRKALLLAFLLALFLAAPLLPFVREGLSDFGSGFLLPLSALGWCVAAGWVMPKKVQSALIGRGPRLDGFFVLWRFSVRWGVPILLLILFWIRVSSRIGT